MPEKVSPSETEFAEFERLILSIDFRQISSQEFVADFRRFGLSAPSHRDGREVGYTFTANDLTVRVWTSWIRMDKKIRALDAGWVLITYGNKAVYFTRPLSRTKNFLQNLLSHAWVARWRVLNRPLCPTCDQFMDIAYGRALKQRYWTCNRTDLHKNRRTTTQPWDLGGLPPRAMRFVNSHRRSRARYKKQLAKEDKKVIPAIMKRIGWRKTKPPHGAS